jgi:phosphatidylserine decarboxylase
VENAAVFISTLIIVATASAAYAFWRFAWFYRSPRRITPAGDNLVSAADGTVVYVKTLAPAEDVIHIKRGLAARLSDILYEDEALPKLVIGVFMSPFDVHFNRSPCKGTIEFVRHHPGRGRNLHMAAMQLRVLMRREPYYQGSVHVLQNERTVTKINGSLAGSALPCYVVQIAAMTVSGIDSYVTAGRVVEKGAIFGMIRIGSQVDVVVPWRKAMIVRVRPGDRVRAGETVLVE